MLPEKPWKLEAILRLGLSIFVCQFLGAVAVATAGYIGGGVMTRAWLVFGLVAGCVLCSAASLWLLHQPWELEGFKRRFALLLVCLYVGLTLGGLAQHFGGKSNLSPSTWRTLVAALCFQGIALLFVMRFVREHAVGWGVAFGFREQWLKALLLGGLAVCVVLPFSVALQVLSISLLTRVHVKAEVQSAVQALQDAESPASLVAMGVAVVALAPLAEEILFRGILYPAVKQAGYPRVAFWGTSLFFAAVHFNLPTFVPLLLLALTFTWLYEKAGNLLAPIAAHCAFNAFNFFGCIFQEQLIHLEQQLRRLLGF